MSESKITSEKHYSDRQLIVTLIDFFTGGSGTMSKTLGFAFYYCLKHPHLMETIQEEIDRETGKHDKMMNKPKCTSLHPWGIRIRIRGISAGEGDS